MKLQSVSSRMFMIIAILAACLLTPPPAQAAGPVTLVVNSALDNESNGCAVGLCTLREALADAPSGATITFDLPVYPAVITLAGPLSTNQTLTITGPGPTQLAISGNNAVRVFTLPTGANLTLNGLTIRDGLSNLTGGGIYNEGSLTLTNCVLTNNHAGTSGGAIYSLATNALTINYSSFTNNSANLDGGALYLDLAGAQITNSTFAYNTSSTGGGLSSSASNVTITNSTFADNQASSTGGGIYASGGSLDVRQSTIVNNTATHGGIYALGAGSLNLDGSIAAGNTGDDCYSTATYLGSNNNLIVSSTGCGSPLLTGDPQLATVLSSNGGPTQTYYPLATSPAIDAYSSANCDNAPLSGLDQRGAARNFDGNNSASSNECDLGAVEYRAPSANCTLSTGVNFTAYGVIYRITNPGALVCIVVEDMGSAIHPLSTGPGSGLGLKTVGWWHIYGLDVSSARVTGGFDLSTSLPMTIANSASRVCKYPGALGGYGWDCGDAAHTSFSLGQVTRTNLTSFSDFAAGDQVGLTAVTLRTVSARPASHPALPGIVTLAGLAAAALAILCQARRFAGAA